MLHIEQVAVIIVAKKFYILFIKIIRSMLHKILFRYQRKTHTNLIEYFSSHLFDFSGFARIVLPISLIEKASDLLSSGHWFDHRASRYFSVSINISDIESNDHLSLTVDYVG